MKKILLFTALFGACLFVLQGCAKDELDTTGSIVGVITDAETAKALSGATVTISPSGKSFTTGVDGRYEFRDIAIGNYTVQATKAGYAENQKSVEVMAGETSSLDLPLRSSAPKLEVSTQTLDFGNNATTLTLDIRNTGSAELTWQVSEDIQWLNCVPTSGSTSIGKTSSVIVNVDRSGLSRGTYTQTIAIASNGGSQTVKVTLSVQEGLSIDVSPESFDFGTTTTALELTLTNPASTTATVAYTLTPSNNWIRVSKVQGQFVGTEKITVSVDRTQLSEGSYTGSLSLTVENRTITIPVKMAVASQAKPTVNLNGLLETSYNTATVQGAVVSIGSSRVTHYGFVWSTAEQPTLENGKKCDLGDTQSPKDFTYQITNLEASTDYYVRAYAQNGEGISYSSQLKFTTLKAPSTPTVETGEASKIQATQAEVTGNLIDLGVETGVTSYGHVWSTQPNPTINDDKTDLGASTRKGTYKSTLTSLQPHVLYYVRAYARNQYGISYGNDVQFTTDYGDVTLTTKPVSAITFSSATCGGTITDLQGNTIAERGVCWNTTGSPARTQSHATSQEQTEDFSVQLSGLSENTKYYVRAYVMTEKGTTFYGQEVQFQTPYEVKVPSLSAVTATDVTYKSASFAATVTSDGHGTLKDAGFVYSTSHNPTVNDSKLSCGVKTSLTASVSTLAPETTYYVRAYATNEKGTAYGAELAITTQADPGNTDIDRGEFGDENNWNVKRQ